MFSRFTALRNFTGQGEQQRKEQQMLMRKGKYATLINRRKNRYLHLPKVSQGEETSMGKIQSNRLKEEGFSVGKETKKGKRRGDKQTRIARPSKQN